MLGVDSKFALEVVSVSSNPCSFAVVGSWCRLTDAYTDVSETVRLKQWRIAPHFDHLPTARADFRRIPRIAQQPLKIRNSTLENVGLAYANQANRSKRLFRHRHRDHHAQLKVLARELGHRPAPKTSCRKATSQIEPSEENRRTHTARYSDPE